MTDAANLANIKDYLVPAFSLLWLIFMAYAWMLSRRQAQLKKDLEDLKRSRQPTVKS
jgi:hypothetical protein